MNFQKDDIAVVIAKAIYTQIPVVGPFISETIGIISEQKKRVLLEERLQILETVIKTIAPTEIGKINKSHSISLKYEEIKNILKERYFNENSFNSNTVNKFVCDWYSGVIVEVDALTIYDQIELLCQILYFCNKYPNKEFNDQVESIAATIISSYPHKNDPHPIMCKVYAEFGLFLSTTGKHIDASGAHMNALLHMRESGYDEISSDFWDGIRKIYCQWHLMQFIANHFLSAGLEDLALRSYGDLIEYAKYHLPPYIYSARIHANKGNRKKALNLYSFYIYEYDKRLNEGASFPTQSQQWRKEAGEFIAI